MARPIPFDTFRIVQGWELKLARLIDCGLEWAVSVSRDCKVSWDDSLNGDFYKELKIT
jgi:hypothetical protein